MRHITLSAAALLALVFLTSIYACGSKTKGASGESDSIAAELPLPDIPATITQPTLRAKYVLERFWEPMDWHDTLLSRDTTFLERNFVNFLSLFPHADEDALHPAVSKLLSSAAQDPTAFDILLDLAEKYLSDPGSPMRNEDYYIVVLSAALSTPDIPRSQLLRPRMQLDRVMKNRPDSVATDFRFTTRQGLSSSLHSLSSPLTLLIFYDPDCPHCDDILEELSASTVVNSLINEGKLIVLAVYTEGNRALWDDRKSSMPQQWTVAIDESSIVEQGLYDIPAMPTLYLLGINHIVLLKDPTTLDLETFLTLKSL